MKLTVEHTEDGAVRLAPTGYIDLDTVRGLAGTTDTLNLAPGSTLVMDLDGVDFVDSSGLSYLVRLRRRVEHAGAHLQVVRPRPPVARVLRITGLDAFLGEPTSGTPAPMSAPRPARP